MLISVLWLGIGCSTFTSGEPLPDPPPPARRAPTASTGPICDDPFVAELVEGARSWAGTSLSEADFGTGTALFDQEWLFGTYAMTAVGLGQHARLCPTEAAADREAMRQALGQLLSPRGLAFDAGKYGAPISDRLEQTEGSIALLGYGGLGLAMYRAVAVDAEPAASLLETEQAWMEAVARRIGDELVETYPGERYPVDNAAAIGALALHDRVTGEDHGAVLARAKAAVAKAVHADSGLLHQAAAADGRPLAHPRGSGTFLSAWFLHRADPELGRSLYEHGRDALGKDVFGVYAMREFLPGVDGPGDVDSGPLIMGFSVSATGFALGGAVAYGDGTTRARILKTVEIGTPMAMQMVPGLETNGKGATGSALGDALMLAMLTSEGSP